MRIELNIGIPMDGVNDALRRRTKRQLCLQEALDCFEQEDYVSNFQYRFTSSTYDGPEGQPVTEDTLVVAMDYNREDCLLDVNHLAAELGEEVIAVYYPEQERGECLGPARYDPTASTWEFDIQFFTRFHQFFTRFHDGA